MSTGGRGHLRYADFGALGGWDSRATSMVGRLGRDLRLAQASRVIWLRFGPKRAEPRCSTRPKSNRLVFFATCARRSPNDVRVTVPGNLSMEDWQMMKEIIAAVRQAIPDASSKPPGAVLEHVLSALGQADAKLIG